jgi:hypothetical protein
MQKIYYSLSVSIFFITLFITPLVADDFIPSYLLDKKLTTTITEEALQRSPQWKDGNANPPVAARKAVSYAETLKSKLVKDTVGHDGWTWHLESISLVPRDNNRWYWLINYKASPNSGFLAGMPPSLHIVVLMNGTVI